MFESLYRENKEIAVHHDLKDENQTIHVVDIQTTATSQKGNHKALASEKATITDTVKYENLQVGKTYTIKGVLMNPETKEALQIDGKTITVERTFKTNQKNGSIDLKFELDATDLEGKKTVVFEDLYLENQKIAVHHDFKDENQTIEFVLPTLKINKVDSLSNTNITHHDFTFTMYADEECTKKAKTMATISEEGRSIAQIEQGTWYIKETKAPSGYQLSGEKIKVEFKENDFYVNGERVEMDEDYVYNMNVKNTSNRSINTGFYNNTFGKWVTLCIATIIMVELFKRR